MIEEFKCQAMTIGGRCEHRATTFFFRRSNMFPSSANPVCEEHDNVVPAAGYDRVSREEYIALMVVES